MLDGGATTYVDAGGVRSGGHPPPFLVIPPAQFSAAPEASVLSRTLAGEVLPPRDGEHLHQLRRGLNLVHIINDLEHSTRLAL